MADEVLCVAFMPSLGSQQRLDQSIMINEGVLYKPLIFHSQVLLFLYSEAPSNLGSRVAWIKTSLVISGYSCVF